MCCLVEFHCEGLCRGEGGVAIGLDWCGRGRCGAGGLMGREVKGGAAVCTLVVGWEVLTYLFDASRNENCQHLWGEWAARLFDSMAAELGS